MHMQHCSHRHIFSHEHRTNLIPITVEPLLGNFLLLADSFLLTLGVALLFWVDGRIEFISLGTEKVKEILFFLAGVVILLERRDSPAASGAFEVVGRGMIM